MYFTPYICQKVTQLKLKNENKRVQGKAKKTRFFHYVFIKNTQIMPIRSACIPGKIGGLNWKPMETLEKQLITAIKPEEKPFQAKQQACKGERGSTQ